MRGTLVAIAIAWAPAAHADPAADAEQAFEHARDLLKQGKLDDACAAFRRSLELDFQYGTLYNLAGCEDKRGKLFAAWQAYRKLGDGDPNPARRQRAAEHATQLEARVPKLVLELPSARPVGFEVSIDGERVADLGAPHPVEIGSHEIVATAPSYQRWRTTIAAGEGAIVTVRPALEALPEAGAIVVPPPMRPERYLVHDFPIAGPTVTIAGGASLVFGIAFAFHARSIYNSSRDAAAMGVPSALADNRNAVRDGNIATWFSVAGLVAVPLGAILWHRGTWIVTPRADARGGAVSLSGPF